jgi:4-azaleucine resistance transporter AzlC
VTPEAPTQYGAVLPTPVRRAVWVLGLAISVFGMSFGVLATTAGLTVPQAVVMSLLVFTGASQFAAVSVVEAGGSMGSALGSALLLAARNAAYGVAMAPTLGKLPLAKRLLGAQVVIDETTAMATAQPEGRVRERTFWATGLSVFAFWNAGTLLGALAGDAIGDPEALGLDAAFPAGFVVLAVPHLRRREGRVAAAAGALIALALIPLAPAGLPIIAASLGVVPGLLFTAREDR